MDGLLIDSEVLWHEAEVEIFGSLGVPIREAEERSTKGMYVNDVVEFWYSLHPWVGPSEDQVVDSLLERVGQLVEGKGRLLPGAVRALDLALDLIYRCLDHFGLRGRFAAVNSAQFEVFGKPHPAVFLSAAAALGVSAPECLVVEDSAAGVLAAKAARMSVIAVPALEDRGLAPFALADLVLTSLEELTGEWLDARFASALAH
jgi:mannitol-1-/sugar-/sorbitol-6-/2-deoxyglucose-6-phosphatase